MLNSTRIQMPCTVKILYEMWVWGFVNHKWYKSLKSWVKDKVTWQDFCTTHDLQNPILTFLHCWKIQTCKMKLHINERFLNGWAINHWYLEKFEQCECTIYWTISTKVSLIFKFLNWRLKEIKELPTIY